VRAVEVREEPRWDVVIAVPRLNSADANPIELAGGLKAFATR